MDTLSIVLTVILVIVSLTAFLFWHAFYEERKITDQYKQSISSLIEKAKHQSEQILKSANTQFKSITDAAKDYNEKVLKYNEDLLNELKDKERTVNMELEKIYVKITEASISLENIKALETATRNRIKGIGEEYILPTHYILDELTNHMGWHDAGQKLKQARDLTRQKVKLKEAIKCVWGDESYQKDAIRIMHEAFDSQVDLAIEKIKGEENIGKVIQEIKDSFISMNDVGTRCMRAEITKDYLECRINEAKWGSVVFELRKREREEQKAIQAELREEAQLARDLERAKREAQREEELARKAMLKAEQETLQKEKEMQKQYERKLKQVEEELLQASVKDENERAIKEAELKAQLSELLKQKEQQSEELHAKFESEKAELERRLKEAEGNQRSLSMAQQTKRGHVYIISNIGSFGDTVLKVGMTRRLDPLDRIWELGDASVPFDFDIHALIQSNNAPELESKLHSIMDDARVNKVNIRKEFFRLTISEVRKIVDDLGINVEWTMTSKALEYRETLALEKSQKIGTENQSTPTLS